MIKKGKIVHTICMILISSSVISCQSESTDDLIDDGLELTTNDTITDLNIPERSESAIEGSEFAEKVKDWSKRYREKAVISEILSGNVPSFSRKLRRITITEEIQSQSDEIVFFTTCDYMAIGSDQDYLFIPMTPSCAQSLADSLNCSLPTKKMVDIIYSKAEIKLRPQPIPPSALMTTVPVFMQHSDSIIQQIEQLGLDRSADNLMGGHKKDIIISNKIYSADRSYDRVVIYGWHRSENDPIQPVYNGHDAQYADYSHGVRLISKLALINEDSIQLDDILMDPNLASLLSHEGVIAKPYYPGQ